MPDDEEDDEVETTEASEVDPKKKKPKKKKKKKGKPQDAQDDEAGEAQGLNYWACAGQFHEHEWRECRRGWGVGGHYFPMRACSLWHEPRGEW